MSKPFHSGGLRGAAKVGAKKGEELKEIYRKAKSAPVPQNELLEAAKEAAIAMSAHIPSAVAVQHASVEWKRTYEAYHRLRTAIRNAEQTGAGKRARSLIPESNNGEARE